MTDLELKLIPSVSLACGSLKCKQKETRVELMSFQLVVFIINNPLKVTGPGIWNNPSLGLA